MDHPKVQQNDGANLRLNFGSYGEEIEVAAVSGDGARVVTVREVGVARVWDVESGRVLAEIFPESPLTGSKCLSPGGEFQVFIESAALNSSGSRLLLGLNDGTALVYDVDEPRRLAVLHPPHEKPGAKWGVIRAVMYTEDDLAVVGFSGRCAGTWSTDGTTLIAFLDPQSTQIFASQTVRDTLTSSVGVSPDGCHVFVGAADMTAFVFCRQSGKIVFEATMHAEGIIGLTDGPGGVGWATTGGNVWMRQSTGELKNCLQTGEHWEEVAFDPRGDRLIARGSDASVTIWTLNGERTLLFESQSGRGLGSAKSTLWLDGDLSHYLAGSCRVALRHSGQTSTFDRSHRVVRAKLNPDASSIAIDGWTDEVGLWDSTTGLLLRSFPSKGGSGCFAFSPDSSLIAIGEIGHGGGLYPRHVYVYETHTRRLVHQLTEHQWQIRSIAFSPNGRLLASLGDDLVVWDLESVGQPITRKRLNRTTGAMQFAGQELVVAEEGRVRVFFEGQERLSFEAPIHYQTKWSISEDNLWLNVAGTQSVLRYRLATGALSEEVSANIPRPERLPKISVAAEHRIRTGAMLWRTEYGTFLHQSDGPRGWVQPLRLSDDLVVLPCEAGAAVFRIANETTKLIGFLPFEGRLRASRVVNGQSIMVNHMSQLFRETVPTPQPPLE